MEPDTRPLTRSDLAQFFKRKDGTPDLRAIIAFENALRDILAQAAAINNGPFVITTADEGLPGANVLVATAPLTAVVAAGTVTLDLADTPVVPGPYGSASKTVSFTVTRRGRIQAAAEYDLDFSNIAGLVAPTQGGTGLDEYDEGDLVFASATDVLDRLPAVAAGNVLLSGGVLTAPAWGQVDLTTCVTGILPAANGGFPSGGFTGSGMYTNFDIVDGLIVNAT